MDNDFLIKSGNENVGFGLDKRLDKGLDFEIDIEFVEDIEDELVDKSVDVINFEEIASYIEMNMNKKNYVLKNHNNNIYNILFSKNKD